MTDLISREAAIAALRQVSARPSSISEIEALPAVEPRVAIGVNGGAVQWALADRESVDVMVIDFDTEGETDFNLNLIKDHDGDIDPAYIWREEASVDPGYFDMLANSPVCNGLHELESAEPNSGAWHIITDVMQCGPDGVHETHEGYYGGSREEALAAHEAELRFFYGEYKTGPNGQVIREPEPA